MFNSSSLKKAYAKKRRISMKPSEFAQFLAVPFLTIGFLLEVFDPVYARVDIWLLIFGFVAIGMFAMGSAAHIFRLRSPRLIGSALNTSVSELDPMGSYSEIMLTGSSMTTDIYYCEGIGALGVKMEGGGSSGFVLAPHDSYLEIGKAVVIADDMVQVDFEELTEGLQNYLLRHTKYRIGNPLFWAISIPNAHRYIIEIYKKGRAEKKATDMVMAYTSSNSRRTQLAHTLKSERQYNNYRRGSLRKGKEWEPVSQLEKEKMDE